MIYPNYTLGFKLEISNISPEIKDSKSQEGKKKNPQFWKTEIH